MKSLLVWAFFSGVAIYALAITFGEICALPLVVPFFLAGWLESSNLSIGVIILGYVFAIIECLLVGATLRFVYRLFTPQPVT